MPRSPAEAAPSGLAPRERLLCEVVATSCITETLSATLLRAMLARAADARVRATVLEILRDEVQHSRLGWAHLAAERSRGYGALLADYLPAMLAGTVTNELFEAGEPSREDDALAGRGALPRRERAELFAATMREVVFPGLERLGIDADQGRIWLSTRLGAPGQAEPVPGAAVAR
jgi:hypothetical protein